MFQRLSNLFGNMTPPQEEEGEQPRRVTRGYRERTGAELHTGGLEDGRTRRARRTAPVVSHESDEEPTFDQTVLNMGERSDENFFQQLAEEGDEESKPIKRKPKYAVNTRIFLSWECRLIVLFWMVLGGIIAYFYAAVNSTYIETLQASAESYKQSYESALAVIETLRAKNVTGQ